MNVNLHNCDCIQALASIQDCSIDAIVTDPPYGLSTHSSDSIRTALTQWLSGNEYTHNTRGFLGNTWDSFVPGPQVWKECFRVLKPGGHILCFASSRTQDLMGIALRLAGFECRDTIMWVYGSGFPKSVNIGNATSEQTSKWNGWGTALKPSYEPVLMCRKPLEGTTVNNVLAYGTGAINIDECRVKTTDTYSYPNGRGGKPVHGGGQDCSAPAESNLLGRWPANLIHDGSDEVVSLFPSAAGHTPKGSKTSLYSQLFQEDNTPQKSDSDSINLDSSAARFYYCAKPSKADKGTNNTHPTVKPSDLMRYLCRLVTPRGGTVLDPFMGSGSTGKAAVLEGFNFTGIEQSPEYFKIAESRINNELKE